MGIAHEEEPDPDDVETLVELSFRDLGDATEIVVQQSPFRTESRRELHHHGWTDSLDKLARFIVRAPDSRATDDSDGDTNPAGHRHRGV